MNEMISELNNSHLYLDGGDFEIPPRTRRWGSPARALRRWTRRPGRYRIAKISPRTERRGAAVPLAALTEVGRCQRARRLRAGDRLARISPRRTTSTERLRQPQDRRGDADAQRQPLGGRRRARDHRTSSVTTEGQPHLPRTGCIEQLRQGDARRPAVSVGYLHIPDMQARRDRRVHQVVLSADPQGRPDRRRALERRRQRRRSRSSSACGCEAARHQLRQHPRRPPGHLPGARYSPARWCACFNETSASDVVTSSPTCSARPACGPP